MNGENPGVETVKAFIYPLLCDVSLKTKMKPF
jgi:hypothetical protein